MKRIFKNKLFLLILVTIFLLVIMGVTTNPNNKLNTLSNIISVPLTPVQKLFSTVGQKFEGAVDFFKDIKETKQENEELKIEVNQLKQQINELEEFRRENQELKKALNLKNQFNEYDFIGANIIATDPGNWFNTYKIDRGSKDGIVIDNAVISNVGLVGRISATGVFSGNVVSIINSDSAVSARISKTRDRVVVRGEMRLEEMGLCRMDYIPLGANIEVGDSVETSGEGGIYPKGITIGTVMEVRNSDSELTRYAIIEPAVDFKRLEEVFVLKEKNEEKIGSEE